MLRNGLKLSAPPSLVAVGPGVERVEQEAAELFPGSRILVLSSDLVESVENGQDKVLSNQCLCLA